MMMQIGLSQLTNHLWFLIILRGQVFLFNTIFDSTHIFTCRFAMRLRNLLSRDVQSLKLRNTAVLKLKLTLECRLNHWRHNWSSESLLLLNDNIGSFLAWCGSSDICVEFSSNYCTMRKSNFWGLILFDFI